MCLCRHTEYYRDFFKQLRILQNPSIDEEPITNTFFRPDQRSAPEVITDCHNAHGNDGNSTTGTSASCN